MCVQSFRYPLEYSLQHCVPYHVAFACLSVRVQKHEARATLTVTNVSCSGAHTSRQLRHPSGGGVHPWCVPGPAQCATCRCSLLSEAPMRICRTLKPMCPQPSTSPSPAKCHNLSPVQSRVGVAGGPSLVGRLRPLLRRPAVCLPGSPSRCTCDARCGERIRRRQTGLWRVGSLISFVLVRMSRHLQGAPHFQVSSIVVPLGTTRERELSEFRHISSETRYGLDVS